MRRRIVLVDDHHLFRAGLRAAIAPCSDLEVAGEAHDARGALAVLQQTAGADVVVLDISLPGSDGIAAAREILRSFRRVKVLILTAHKGPDYVRQAFAAGASGYVLKDETPEDVLEAIRAVARGETHVSPAVPRPAPGAEATPGARGVLDCLSAREREIFSLIVHGHSSQDIARQLCISLKTVETHRSHINQKLGVHSTSEIVRLAAMHDLLPD